MTTPYGLAAGIFTSDLATAFEAAERLEMGIGAHQRDLQQPCRPDALRRG